MKNSLSKVPFGLSSKWRLSFPLHPFANRKKT